MYWQKDLQMPLTVLGVGLGVFLFWLLNELHCWVMLKAFRCEKIYLMDKFFSQDKDTNCANIMGVLFFESFDFEEMKSFLIKNSRSYHKLRAKIVQIMGDVYWQDMTEEDFMARSNEIFQLVEGIHTEEELHDYLCKE